MQLALRPYATAGVVVVGAGLIYVTPVAAPHIEQRAVHLAATETLSDLVGPFDAVASSLGGVGGSMWDSVTDALAPVGGALSSELSGVLPSLGDLSGTLADAADSTGLTNLWALLGALFDPYWPQWEQFFGPIILVGGIFLGGFVGILQGYWEEILTALGIQPASALTAAATEALDPSALTSALDLNPLAEIGTAFDPAAMADIGTAFDPAAMAEIGTAFDPAVLADIGAVLSTGAIPDLGGILTSLIP
ncbi:MAG TPA: hypothetical protein VE908_21470 [Mycobacterium sp.]|nr:hypothetical protein [Mycobacterium sp.]